MRSRACARTTGSRHWCSPVPANGAFSAGQDINESNDFDEDRAERWINEFRALYSSVRSLEKPVVAAVNGVAAGSAFSSCC